jgi:DHA1 family bicyclomycin/chloramphenicol resistance-like MFS transporter
VTVTAAARAGRAAGVVAGSREFLAIIASCMAMAALSIDVLLPAFPEIRAEFGLAEDSTAVAGLITAFFFGLAVGQLFYGPLSDRFGRKPLLFAGLAVYIVGAVAATVAPTLAATIACRFVWGLGAAAPRSLALAMVRDTYEGERMARAMSHVMATFILVPVFAPSIGAAFMWVFPWRVVFWLPVIAASGLAVWALRLPETLAPERRRSVSPAALAAAARTVFSTRQTIAFGLAATALFGVMSSYIAGFEVIVEDVYDQGDRFPVIFGVLAITFGVGSLLSAWLVMRLGLHRLLRAVIAYDLTAATVLVIVVVATGGEPPLWLFCVLLAFMLPGVTALFPNVNTAAMAPVPHVAGMAAAVLGTLATGGGALLGAVVDRTFDGTAQPFAIGALVYISIAAVFILRFARPRQEQAGGELSVPITS